MSYLDERLLSTVASNGQGGEFTEYNHQDELGTRVVTNQQSGTSYEQTTLPFGTSLDAETSGTTSKRFTSYERSNRTGLDYAINRTYDSKQGRFTQVDPIGMKAVDLNIPQTLNLYNYCGNDPINHTDPDGLSWFSKLFRIFRTIGNIISNILKMVVFVAIVVLSIATFGLVLGIIVSIAITVLPHLLGIVAKTIYRNIKQSIQENGLTFRSFFRGLWRGIKQSFTFLKSIITRKLFDQIGVVYGYWCGPGYGIDGPTRDQEPIDELDRACQQHDRDSRQADDMLRAGLISEKEWKRLKTKFDLRFLRRVILSDNRATGGFLVGLYVGFFLRIIFR